MKLTVKKAVTSKIVHLFLSDSAATDGSGKTGVLYSDVTGYYIRPGDVGDTEIVMATATIGTYATGGFIEVDAVNMPGIYEFSIPDACLATGADQVVIMLKGTGIAPLPLEIQLDDNTAKDVYDRVGAPVGLSISADLADVPTVAEFDARTILAADYFDPAVDTVANVTTVATLTGHTAQTGDTFAQLPTNFSDLAITLTTGLTDVNDKTGFSLAADQSTVTIGTVNALGAQAKLDVNAEVDTALADINLDHLIQISSTVNDLAATTSSFVTALIEATDNHYNNHIILFTSGALAGQGRRISDYDGTSFTVTVSPAFTDAPADADSFVILGFTLNEAMRGTDSAALASVCTELRLAELDTANIPTDIANVKTDTAAILLDTGTDGVLLAPTATSAQLTSDNWDVILTGDTHNIATSAGKRLRELSATIILNGTSPDTSGTTNTSTSIELDASASATDGAYDPAIVCIIGGTGVGQSRQIFEYDGTNKIAYVNRDWKVIPDSTSEYIIKSHSGDTHVNEGVAQAGALDSITLNVLASATDNTYNRQLVFIVAGTGADQARRVSGYVGLTKVASVTPDWDVAPDATSIYVMLPAALSDSASVDAILEDTSITLETHLTDIKGTGFIKDTDSLPQCLTATGFSTHVAADIWSVVTRALTDKIDFSLVADQSLVTIGTANALGTQAKADVNAEVSDVVKTDTVAEMDQGAPPVAPTIEQMLNYIYRQLRNKVETTATETAIYDDAGTTKLFKGVLSDDGITFTKAQLITGL